MSFVWWQLRDPCGSTCRPAAAVDFWVTDCVQYRWSSNINRREEQTGCDYCDYCDCDYLGIMCTKGSFTSLAWLVFLPIFLTASIKARLKFITVLGHVCEGFMDPNFERGVALWSHWARKWWGSLRGREGRQMLWCAEIDNIKGSLTKKHTHAHKNPLSGHCTRSILCYYYLDECEADGWRLWRLYPRLIWDMIFWKNQAFCE